MTPPDTQVNVTTAPHDRGPDRTEFEVLKRDVQWLKYGVCVSAGTGVFTAAMNLGAAPMPAAVAGIAAAVGGAFR
jgi:hypothetical protein